MQQGIDITPRSISGRIVGEQNIIHQEISHPSKIHTDTDILRNIVISGRIVGGQNLTRKKYTETSLTQTHRHRQLQNNCHLQQDYWQKSHMYLQALNLFQVEKIQPQTKTHAKINCKPIVVDNFAGFIHLSSHLSVRKSHNLEFCLPPNFRRNKSPLVASLKFLVCNILS